MGLRNALINLQFGDAPPNTVLGFNEEGQPVYIGAFQQGRPGLVPTPPQDQPTYVLRADGSWGPGGSGGGGDGTVKGTGVSNRLSFWSNTDTIGSNANLVFDSTNNILKTSTLNLARNGLPSGGITNGDILYDNVDADFRARINGSWTNITRAAEFTIDSTSFTPTEEHRNAIVRLTANTTITVNLTQLSAKYGITLIKAGNGNVVVTTGVTNTYTGVSNTISVSGAAAHFYHLSGNQWRGYGTLGSIGTGTVRRVTLLGVSGFLGVSNPNTINTEGDLQLTLNTQNPSTFLRGPLPGANPAVPTFGSITVGDLPKIAFSPQSIADYTLREVEDFGRTIDLSNTGTITIRIPTLSEGWYCSIYRGPNAGNVNFVRSGGGTIESEANTLGTPKTMAAIIIFPDNRAVIVGKLS